MEGMAVWVVQGHEGCDSSGGTVTLLLITKSGGDPPDVQASYRALREKDSCSLYQIDSIKLLGTLPVCSMLLVDDGWS